jgi:hypothetical protein
MLLVEGFKKFAGIPFGISRIFENLMPQQISANHRKNRSIQVKVVFFLILILSLFWQVSWAAAGEKEVLLIFQPVSKDDFIDMNMELLAGDDPVLAETNDRFLVIGTINDSSFSVSGFNKLIAYDAAGQPLSLIIDRSSVYSEFDDGNINSMRIAFLIDSPTFQGGSVRLSWGESLNATNQVVEQIKIYENSLDRYRTFLWESKSQQENTESYAASLEIIVDDQADIYYLWYLLPLVILFVLLIVRKKLLK